MRRKISQCWQSFLLAAVVILVMIPASAAFAAEQAPTKEIVEKVLKSSWDKSGAEYPNVKAVLTLNEIKFGKAYLATLQEVQVEGFPEGTMVTPAIVDFTVRTYYNTETNALRRAREARVYKDKFDEWAVMTGGVRGEDTTTKEPAGT